MTTLLAVRHAPTAPFAGFVGQSDVPIAVPLAVAREAALAAFQGFDLTEVWSSPLCRCLDTAAAVARVRGVPLRVDRRLLEISHGAWENRAFADLERQEPEAWANYCAHWASTSPPGGEPLSSFAGRVSTWWAEREQRSALVGHAGVLRALLVVVDGLTWSEALSPEIPHLGDRAAWSLSFRRA